MNLSSAQIKRKNDKGTRRRSKVTRTVNRLEDVLDLLELRYIYLKLLTSDNLSRVDGLQE
ncbi:MAG: hypothetical protein ACOCRO_06900 [Halanaerobiales bacterium]